MPRYKVLKSVAHNLGHAYLSLMNYRAGEHVVTRLYHTARQCGEPRIEIDVRRGTIEPACFQTPVLCASVADLSGWFGHAVHSQGSALEMVDSVCMTIEFDLARTHRHPVTRHAVEVYWCEVEIVDVRGKRHTATVREWWRT